MYLQNIVWLLRLRTLELSQNIGLQSVWPEKIGKCLKKLPNNDFTRKINDFDKFTKIA